jgi:hypothetical protein
MTCCIKNLKGLIPDGEKRRYHSSGLTKAIAALGSVIKPHLHVIDSICGDLDFEEGGSPVESNRILLGFDQVLLDSYCAALLGYHPDEIGYLRLAKEHGDGRYAGPQTIVTEFGADMKPRTKRFHSAGAEAYAPMIDDDGACSACYAALVYALRQTGGLSQRGDKTGGAFRAAASSRTVSQSRAGAHEKIKVGQGHIGKKSEGVGSGDCASGCDHYVRGCPPSAYDIAQFIRQIR